MAFRSLLETCIIAAAVVFTTAPTLAQQPRKVTMSLAGQSMIATIPRLAKELGLFEKRDIDITFVTMDSANASATALISGSVPFAFAGPGELVSAQARGREVVAIVNNYGGLGGSLVLSKATVDKLGVSPSAPLAARLKALNGLIIAAPSATSTFAVSYKGAAAAAGADARFTFMAMQNMPAALESGAIQGYVASAPFWAAPVTSGNGVLWISGPKGELPAELRPKSTSVLLTTRETINASPELVRSVAGVFADFIEALDRRPAEVRTAISKIFPNVDSRTLDLLLETETLAWKANPLTSSDIAHEIAYMKASGVNLPAQIDKIDPASLIWR